MGKTPLLPLFAASLGASDALLGIIVSVSTLTGMLLKPLFGFLSDRQGQRIWLLIGTALFCVIPFFYVFVDSPSDLFILRIIHGLATAIYGPVTLAFIGKNYRKRAAERFAWFSIARSLGYIVGPIAAGSMLLTMEASQVFKIIGFLSMIVFIPIALLPKEIPKQGAKKEKIDLVQAVRTTTRTSGIWLAGSLETVNYIVLYALRAFLPIYILSIGYGSLSAGAFFTIQETIHLLTKPLLGRLGDRWGYVKSIVLGMIILSLAVAIISVVEARIYLFFIAFMIGSAQSLIFPATLALISKQITTTQLGFNLGVVGALRNAGKVIGPIISGILISVVGYTLSFQILSVGLLLFIIIIILSHVKDPLSSKYG